MIKRISILCALLFSPQMIGYALRLAPVKSKTHHMSLRKDFLQTLAHAFKADTFVETGTARGETTNVAKDVFKEVHSIEIDKKLYMYCTQRFQANPHVKLHLGDSVEKLPEVVSGLKNKSVVFWLDGHNSPGMDEGVVNTPLIEELLIIKAANLKDSIILIDDIRCALWTQYTWEKLEKKHGSDIRALYDDVGQGWPTLKKINDTLLDVNPNFTIVILGDILIAFDKKKNPVTISPVLEACMTSLRSYGEKVDEKSLIRAEMLIASADKLAFQALQEQADIHGLYEYSLYHPHIHHWLGLIFKKRNESAKSAEHLTKGRVFHGENV